MIMWTGSTVLVRAVKGADSLREILDVVSYPGGRMPVWRSQDSIRRDWLYLICTADFLASFITMFGRTDGVAHQLLRTILPTWLWASMLMLAALGILLGFNLNGSLIGSVVWGALTGASLLAVVSRTALWDAGWVPSGFLLACHLAVFQEVRSGRDADREWRQRGG